MHSGAPPGLEAKVTGPGGVSYDASQVFKSINGKLLLVTVLLVFVLLILIYRSPIFWAIPLLSVGLAEAIAEGVGYLMTQLGVTINSQSAGILTVLVFGTGTDYALLLVARYREELRHHASPHDAMRIALRRAGPVIFASASTVILALLCVLAAEVNSTRGLGPISAIGVALAMLVDADAAAVAAADLRPPRVLAVRARATARAAPTRRMARGGASPTSSARRHRVIAAATHRAPRRALHRPDEPRHQPERQRRVHRRGRVRAGPDAARRALPGGRELTAADRRALGGAGRRGPGGDRRGARREPRARRAQRDARQPDHRRRRVHRGARDRSDEPARDVADRTDPQRPAKAAGGPDTLIGGATAQQRDLHVAAARDDRVIVPLILVVVMLVLGLLLRSLVAPVLLVATVIFSYAAALGAGAFVFGHILGYAGEDPSLILFSFLFLVALGCDYNIFLMARAREESTASGDTRAGMLRALSVTGAVITSAGIVLAGTFSALASLPLVAFAEVGLVIAFGVLLDTFLVRTVLVPALVMELDGRVWWPSALSRRRGPDKSTT